jgi:fumarate reductase subunit C
MESKSSGIEDASFILFLLPVAVSGIFAIYAAVTSSAFNVDTYIAVTGNPIVFIVAVVSVCAALLLEIYYSPPDMRSKKVNANARRMQRLAVVTLVLTVLAALVALGAAPLPLILGTFLAGRYPILFSALLVFLSFLIVVPFKFQMDKNATTNAISIVLLVLSPIAYFVGSGGSIPFEPRAAAAVALLILGLLLIVRNNKGMLENKTA